MAIRVANAEGLAVILAANAARFVATDPSQFGTSDIKRELGLTLSHTQYVNRLQALTDPTAYSDARTELLNGVTAEVEIAYQKAFARYSNAGLPSEQCKAKAVAAARDVRDREMELVELQFPAGANAVGAKSLVKRSKARHFPGSLDCYRGI
jgi:hypothetical protein